MDIVIRRMGKATVTTSLLAIKHTLKTITLISYNIHQYEPCCSYFHPWNHTSSMNGQSSSFVWTSLRKSYDDDKKLASTIVQKSYYCPSNNMFQLFPYHAFFISHGNTTFSYYLRPVLKVPIIFIYNKIL